MTKIDKPPPVPIPNWWPDPCDFGGLDIVLLYNVYKLFRRVFRGHRRSDPR